MSETMSPQPLESGDAMHQLCETMAGAIEPTTRGDIERLQLAMQAFKCPMPEAIHHFAPGMYCRELTLPALHIVVGKIHKHAHFMAVLKGKAIVYTEHGEDLVEPGYITISQPGAKRVVVTLEDTTFVTIHSNTSNTEDLSQIEYEHIEPESEEYMEAESKLIEILKLKGVKQ